MHTMSGLRILAIAHPLVLSVVCIAIAWRMGSSRGNARVTRLSVAIPITVIGVYLAIVAWYLVVPQYLRPRRGQRSRRELGRRPG